MSAQEISGLTEFPQIRPPNAFEREILSDHDFAGLGTLRVVIYRVGFQIQREVRNDFEPWLRYYKAKIETADHTQIGQGVFRIINGSYIEDYQEEFQMSELGAQELEDIGGLLYGKDGTLQERWHTGSSSGTKVFGPELSAKDVKCALLDCVDQAPAGDFLMIEEQYRRHGVGIWALHTFLQVLKSEGVKFILTRPAVPRLYPHLRGTGVERTLLSRNIAFVRKAGFRRVGLSPVFAYMLSDDNHPSRSLPADRDVDPA